jgi:hypothetical protein
MIAGLDVLQAVVGLLVNQRLQWQLEGAPDDGHNSARNMLIAINIKLIVNLVGYFIEHYV